MSIATQLHEVLKNLPQGVRLVAVSKFQPNEAIEEAYREGQRIFGESRAQELKTKHETLPQDIEWHFIGTLQTNKIKYIIPYVAMIHGIDSHRLLLEVNKQAEKVNRVVDCLLQIHIAQEDTKFGFSFDECRYMLNTENRKTLQHVRIRGLMGMASNTEDEKQIKQEFRSLYEFFKELKETHFVSQPAFNEISMGMSHDYHLAIAAGSTLVRVGSLIFGQRSTYPGFHTETRNK